MKLYIRENDFNDLYITDDNETDFGIFSRLSDAERVCNLILGNKESGYDDVVVDIATMPVRQYVGWNEYWLLYQSSNGEELATKVVQRRTRINEIPTRKTWVQYRPGYDVTIRSIDSSEACREYAEKMRDVMVKKLERMNKDYVEQ